MSGDVRRWPGKWKIQWRHCLLGNVIAMATFTFVVYSSVPSPNAVRDDRPKVVADHSASSVPPLGFQVKKWTPADSRAQNWRIFFHETSGRNDVTARQACSIESTARHNPDRPIQLLILADSIDDASSGGWISSVLSQYDNVAVVLLGSEPGDYFAGTPLERWFRTGDWKSSPFRNGHLADYIRMVSAVRAGGTYMDIDFVSLKPLLDDGGTFWNFLSVIDESRVDLANGIFHLEHGHWLAQAVLDELAANYDPEDWAGQGPLLLNRIMLDLCGLRLPDVGTNQCEDLKILPHHHFFPVDYRHWSVYFQEATAESLALLERSQAVHVWNHESHGQDQQMGLDRLYDVLAATHCPLTFAKASGR